MNRKTKTSKKAYFQKQTDGETKLKHKRKTRDQKRRHKNDWMREVLEADDNLQDYSELASQQNLPT